MDLQLSTVVLPPYAQRAIYRSIFRRLIPPQKAVADSLFKAGIKQTIAANAVKHNSPARGDLPFLSLSPRGQASHEDQVSDEHASRAQI
jgi:hypothetical protein